VSRIYPNISRLSCFVTVGVLVGPSAGKSDIWKWVCYEIRIAYSVTWGGGGQMSLQYFFYLRIV
jgi:hypothetical protein